MVSAVFHSPLEARAESESGTPAKSQKASPAAAAAQPPTRPTTPPASKPAIDWSGTALRVLAQVINRDHG